MLARCPKTPLRALCIGAFEYFGRLRGGKLDHTRRRALAYACDFGALRNDFYDQRELNRRSYRELRQRLRGLVPDRATHRYIQNLRAAERGRPVFRPHEGFEPGEVVAYRLRVLVLSLEWLQEISRKSIEPRLFQALVALVALIQLVDDLIDWKDDWACRRPTYVTAYSHQWAQPSRKSLRQLQCHADRLRSELLAERNIEAMPFMLAGLLTWILAAALIKVRFPR